MKKMQHFTHKCCIFLRMQIKEFVPAERIRVCMPMNAQTKELIKSFMLLIFQVFLFWLPPRKNRVMVYVHARRGVTCNPKYIVRKLHEMYGSQLEIIWTTSYPETCGELQAMGLEVTAFSKKNVWKYLRTKVYITNDAFPSWALHRHGQVWINTWHGGMNYKHIGYGYLPPMNVCERALFRLENRKPDVFLSGSRFFTEDTSRSFCFPAKVFVPTGLPRNDLFFGKREDTASLVRMRLGIPIEDNVVLYAPTFRKELTSRADGMDFKRLTSALQGRFGGSWSVLFRDHCFIEKGSRQIPNVTDVSDYPDMQELLLVSDVLVSDYSSCMWDFCLTGNPCFVFAGDQEEYEQTDRGYACPMEKWPYMAAYDMEQLEQNIRSFDAEGYSQKVTTHLQEMKSYDKGNAAWQVAEMIGAFCNIDRHDG